MRRWSQESIVCALKRWYDTYGYPPTSRALLRYRPDWMPTVATVKEHFGSFNAGLEAAGLPTRSRGCPGHLLQPPARDQGGRLLSYSSSGGW